MSLFADSNMSSDVAIGVVFVAEKKRISTHEYVSEPLEDFCVVYNLMLNQFLRD